MAGRTQRQLLPPGRYAPSLFSTSLPLYLTNLSRLVVLLVAGDVCESTEKFRTAFSLLVGKFGVVFWVCGNHELYLKKEHRDCGQTSLDKLADLMRICDELGVFTHPCMVEDSADPMEQRLWIVPLLAWHHISFDTET